MRLISIEIPTTIVLCLLASHAVAELRLGPIRDIDDVSSLSSEKPSQLRAADGVLVWQRAIHANQTNIETVAKKSGICYPARA